MGAAQNSSKINFRAHNSINANLALATADGKTD